MDFLFCTLRATPLFGFETSPPTEESLRSFVNYHQLEPTNIRFGIYGRAFGECCSNTLVR